MLDRLVDAGRTVIVIEHNLDVVARADWVIDLGPGAGHDGGAIVFQGPPADILRSDASLTGQHLRRRLEASVSAA
jgi:excinuclease UvrABC ATPase subunit